MSNKTKQMVQMDRRQALKAAGAGVVALGFATTAHATPESAAEALSKAIGGAATSQSDKVKFVGLPEIAENGAVVPVGVSVDSPMSADNYVKHIHVFADGNPSPETISFHLTATGKAEVNTRVRLGKTQNIIAAAVMSDGSVITNKQEVKVTIGGCGG